VEGAIESICGAENIEGNWGVIESLGGWCGTGMSMSAIKGSSVGGAGQSANSTAG
jgi:hypothetical protein